MRVVIGATLVALTGLTFQVVGCAGSTETATTTGTGTTSGQGGSTGTGGAGGAGGDACVPADEACGNGLDDDCDGEVDESCRCQVGDTQPCYSGPPGTEGVGSCAPGTQDCDPATNTWGACAGDVLPASADDCNGEDDDCDGAVDEGIADIACGFGACAVTVAGCEDGEVPDCIPAQPSSEICDGLDNDCDQLTDEDYPGQGSACDSGIPGVCAAGTQVCQGGMPSCMPGAMPSIEACDGLDNDCNGTADDNIPGTGGMCSTGSPGVCSVGTISCQAGTVDCFPLVMPSPEACDGIDNDCDGAVDNGDPEGGAVCNTGQPGICAPGVLHCISGSVTCVADATSASEVCNNQDDDCDGAVDDGNPGGGVACTTGVPGVCSSGTTSCTNGAVVCNQTVQPSAEICNVQDDDCDGLIDDGNPQGGAACVTGLQGVCSPGTMTCTGGQLVCTQNVQPSAEVCGNAADENCDGVAVASPTVYFSEAFANNLAGWTLTQNWSIGPTAFSAPNTSCGIGDPASDHTPTADNGVAGNVLGGNISQAIGGPYYLTSPIIDTSAAPTVYLEYWRWLHSDYPSFMTDRVEVFNGASWITVWQNPNSIVVNDTQWTKMSHNITAYKNAQMRVRFSYQVGSSGVFLCAGWNVDDVQIVNAQCN